MENGLFGLIRGHDVHQPEQGQHPVHAEAVHRHLLILKETTMNFAKSILSRALLAAALATGAGAAVAGPVYHVDINTTSFTGLSGYLDMTFLPGVDTGPATATVSHFTGDFGAYVDMAAPGVSGSVDTKVVFDNGQYANLFRAVDLGGVIGFDVSFDGPATGFGGTDFDVSLYDDTGMNALLASVVHFTLQPNSVTATFDEQFASVGPAAAVPEPSAALLVLIGLAMAGAVARRRA
jgi:hypothetical protein